MDDQDTLPAMDEASDATGDAVARTFQEDLALFMELSELTFDEAGPIEEEPVIAGLDADRFGALDLEAAGAETANRAEAARHEETTQDIWEAQMALNETSAGMLGDFARRIRDLEQALQRRRY